MFTIFCWQYLLLKSDLMLSWLTRKLFSSFAKRFGYRSKKKDSEIDGDLTLVREITEVDKEKISALDWMIYYPHQRAESIWECNTLIRAFIAQGKLPAARLAFDRIPSDSMEMILQQYSENGVVDRDALPPKVGAAIKEFLSYKAYLDAQEGKDF